MAGLGIPDLEWLSRHDEPAIDPDRRICDPHHHFWDRPMQSGARFRYLFDEFLADVTSGHNVCASVLVEGGARLRVGLEGGAMYRAAGPVDRRSLGETEFLNGMGAMMASGAYGPTELCQGIVAYVDLRLGDAVQPVLDLHTAFSRVRGVRNLTWWHAVPELAYGDLDTNEAMLMEPGFRAGFATLARSGLTYDATALTPQIPEVTDLARAFPDAAIVLNHIGGIIATGPFQGRRAEAFSAWKTNLAELARCPNVFLKLGGMASPRGGFGLAQRPKPASSAELAELWRPYVETCIDLFGPQRCMFESNFPVEKQAVSYRVLWNAFKRLAAPYSETEKDFLFYRSAVEFYGLDRAAPVGDDA
jgi:predicted TIM-barrel fold metal-dependent hydrolase